jgi:cytidylate kinase
MGIIVNIRGCSGAGKTTLARALMERHGPAIPIERSGMKRYEGYQLPAAIRVVGDYRRVCGGAEGMKDEEIERVVRDYAASGSVVFEGLFITENVSRWRNLAIDLGNVVFAFLQPPVEVCIQRVEARRQARGTTKPFDSTRLKQTWRRLTSHYQQFEAVGAHCVWLPWADPVPELEGLLGLNAGVQGRTAA